MRFVSQSENIVGTISHNSHNAIRDGGVVMHYGILYCTNGDSLRKERRQCFAASSSP
jgi:hypothetical protein